MPDESNSGKVWWLKFVEDRRLDFFLVPAPAIFYGEKKARIVPKIFFGFGNDCLFDDAAY